MKLLELSSYLLTAVVLEGLSGFSYISTKIPKCFTFIFTSINCLGQVIEHFRTHKLLNILLHELGTQE